MEAMLKTQRNNWKKQRFILILPSPATVCRMNPSLARRVILPGLEVFSEPHPPHWVGSGWPLCSTTGCPRPSHQHSVEFAQSWEVVAVLWFSILYFHVYKQYLSLSPRLFDLSSRLLLDFSYPFLCSLSSIPETNHNENESIPWSSLCRGF